MNIRTTSAWIAAFCGLALIAFGPAAGAQRSHAPKVKLTVEQANAIALKKVPGTIVGKSVLENEEGALQYGVMVRSGKTLREIMVNANTGRIDSIEVTTAAKEAVEAANDKAHKGATGGHQAPAHRSGQAKPASHQTGRK